VTRTVSPEGDMIIELENLNDKPIKYHLNVKGGNAEVYINSEGNTYIGNNNNQIQFDGDKIFIGSRLYAGKAKEVGINAERIILGNSNFYYPEIKTEIQKIVGNAQYSIDDFSTNDYRNPDKIQHQWAVMGETLVHLLKTLIEYWRDTKYVSGNTVCKVSEFDKTNMTTDVLNKLHLILSSNVSLINRKEDPNVN
jgi:hypothetical protein